MPFALLLVLVAVAGATLLTYLYERDASFLARLCVGVCTGFAALGLAGFAAASVVGLNAASLAVAGVVTALPLLLLKRREVRARAGEDVREAGRVVRRAIVRPGRGETGALVFYCCAAVLFWLVFDRAMYVEGGAIYTGGSNNTGDLPFHIGVISSFLYGENFPPQHPEFAGTRLTYPFVVDFVTAMLVRAGASLKSAMFWQNFVLVVALVGVVHRWALVLTRDRLASLLTPALILFSGGFGWAVFLREAAESGQGVFAFLKNLPEDYTIITHLGYRWGNAITALLITQRSWLLGVPLALTVWVLWWKATAAEGGTAGEGEGEKGRRGERETARIEGAKGKARKQRRAKRGERASAAHVTSNVSTSPRLPVSLSPLLAFSPTRLMLAAGLIAGLMPLAHAHSFAVVMGMGALVALALAVRGWLKGGRPEGVALWPSVLEGLRPWGVFFGVALLVAAPQLWLATTGTGMKAGNFVGVELGWDHGKENALWFWLKNTGLFIPLLLAALLWRGARPVVPPRLLCFYLPFTLCFIVPNLLRLSPWIWDNIKILFWWWIASAPLVALLLARLWRAGAVLRVAAAAALLTLTLAGALDVWRTVSGVVRTKIFGSDAVAFAEVVKRVTPPRSLILHSTAYNDPVFLTGRRSYVGYTGHLWSHGLDYRARELEMRRIYEGAADAAALLERAGIDYVVVGPQEREEARRLGLRLNESFFQRYTKVGEAGEYRLYQTRP